MVHPPQLRLSLAQACWQSETHPSSVNTAYTRHSGRLTGVNGIRYILDANGNRTQMTDWEGMTTYSYDALDRLMQATLPDEHRHLHIDSVGNRLSNGMVEDLPMIHPAASRIFWLHLQHNAATCCDSAATYSV
ncbi:MAG: RHS repeat protein [Caldilinea sp.]|nr:RHS repeat protein [Caldilinea sp.]